MPIVLTAVALRLFVGSGLAAALGASDQLPTPFAAFLAGLAAPLMVAKIFAAIPLKPAEVHDASPVSDPLSVPLKHPGINGTEIPLARVEPEPEKISEVRDGAG
jgi:hypothetical protein